MLVANEDRDRESSRRARQRGGVSGNRATEQDGDDEG